MNSQTLVLSGWARHSVAKLWTRGCENLTLHSSFLSETHETAANMFCAKWSLNSWREILPSLVPTSKTGSAGFVTCSHAGQAKEGRKGLSTYRVARNCFLSQNKPHQLMTTQNSVIINYVKCLIHWKWKCMLNYTGWPSSLFLRLCWHQKIVDV